jgi:uncharacterized protein YgiM (DUF1202 family)
MVEETEKTSIEILNDMQLQNSQSYMSWEELYLYEIMKYSFYADHNKDELGLEGGTDGY